MQINVRVPVFENGKFDHFNYHELKISGNSYNFGNCHFLGEYELKDPELFSGLKDMNGTAIYLNDYVHLREYGEVYKQVIFHQGSFCIHGFNFNPKNCVVVGNIHEMERVEEYFNRLAK
jgi:hypothetical protein